MKKRLICCIFAALIIAAFFTGCATPQTLYAWGNYESMLYAFLKGETREAQIEAFESDFRAIESEGKSFPPGFYAHMGLLYLDSGNVAGAADCFEKEKALFPEAAPFMDFLLKGFER